MSDKHSRVSPYDLAGMKRAADRDISREFMQTEKQPAPSPSPATSANMKKELLVEVIATLELAELWLLNCAPVTKIHGDTPLPKIRKVLALLKKEQ